MSCAEYIVEFIYTQWGLGRNIKEKLIRCKDCKHRDPEDKKCDSGHGIMWQLPRPDDWYCADGERKEQ